MLTYLITYFLLKHFFYILNKTIVIIYEVLFLFIYFFCFLALLSSKVFVQRKWVARFVQQLSVSPVGVAVALALRWSPAFVWITQLLQRQMELITMSCIIFVLSLLFLFLKKSNSSLQINTDYSWRSTSRLRAIIPDFKKIRRVCARLTVWCCVSEPAGRAVH